MSIKKELQEELNAIQEYIKDNEIEGYHLIVTDKTNAKYFIASNYTNQPHILLATLELALLEFKLRFAMPSLAQTIKDKQQDDLLPPTFTIN